MGLNKNLLNHYSRKANDLDCVEGVILNAQSLLIGYTRKKKNGKKKKNTTLPPP